MEDGTVKQFVLKEPGYGVKEHFDQLFIVQYKIIVIVSLLEYLEKNHLIYFSPLWEGTHEKFLLNDKFVFRFSPFKFRICGDSISDYICDKFYDSIFPSPELIEFVKNGFKDKEQIRHEENVRLQSNSLEQAKKSTIAATHLGWLSTAIAILSFIAAVMSLVPEQNRIQWYSNYKQLFSTTGKINPIERQVNNNKAGAVIGRKNS